MSRFPHLDAIHQIARLEYGLTEGSFTKNRQVFGKVWEEEFENLLKTALPDEEHDRKALAGYTEYIVDAMRRQVDFQREGVYSVTRYSQADETVYQNEDKMMNEYLPGLLISQFLWVHHYRHLLFFKTFFVKDISAATDQRFHDVGIGTGFHSNVILNTLPGSWGHGWDLSPHSLRFAEDLLTRFGTVDRYAFHLKDILKTESIEPLPYLISVEVLEHLENPLEFLVGLKRMILPGGKAFITAALNSPHEDHVYLYRNENEVLSQVRAAGFSVECAFSAYAYPPSKRLPLVPSVLAVVAAA